jgi:hypothetical protein
MLESITEFLGCPSHERWPRSLFGSLICGIWLFGTFLDGRFFDQHHRNVINDWIYAMALLAFQAFLVRR